MWQICPLLPVVQQQITEDKRGHIVETRLYVVFSSLNDRFERKSFNNNDWDQLLWARETEHPTQTLVFTISLLVLTIKLSSWSSARNDSYQRCPLTRSRSAKLRYRLPLQCAIWAPGSILIWTCRLMCLRLVLARFIICTISGTLGSICLVSPPRGLFTRSSQAGLTTVMVYCTVLLSIKLRNFRESWMPVLDWFTVHLSIVTLLLC